MIARNCRSSCSQLWLSRIGRTRTNAFDTPCGKAFRFREALLCPRRDRSSKGKRGEASA
jgi:hypothetical protein